MFKFNGYVLNYIILITHSSTWNFTHTCMSNNLLLMYEYLPLCEFLRPFCGLWTSSTHSLLSNELFRSLMYHPWASMCQLHTSFMHGNLALHRCLVPLTIILLYWVFFLKSFVWAFMGLVWCNIPSSFYLRKRPILAPLAKELQIHTSRSHSNYERNLDNLATFTPH